MSKRMELCKEDQALVKATVQTVIAELGEEEIHKASVQRLTAHRLYDMTREHPDDVDVERLVLDLMADGCGPYVSAVVDAETTTLDIASRAKGKKKGVRVRSRIGVAKRGDDGDLQFVQVRFLHQEWDRFEAYVLSRMRAHDLETERLAEFSALLRLRKLYPATRTPYEALNAHRSCNGHLATGTGS